MPIFRILDALGFRRRCRVPDMPVPPEPFDHPSLRAMTLLQLADLPPATLHKRHADEDDRGAPKTQAAVKSVGFSPSAAGAPLPSHANPPSISRRNPTIV
jgi:hypothetical protein